MYSILEISLQIILNFRDFASNCLLSLILAGMLANYAHSRVCCRVSLTGVTRGVRKLLKIPPSQVMIGSLFEQYINWISLQPAPIALVIFNMHGLMFNSYLYQLPSCLKNPPLIIPLLGPCHA